MCVRGSNTVVGKEKKKKSRPFHTPCSEAHNQERIDNIVLTDFTFFRQKVKYQKNIYIRKRLECTALNVNAKIEHSQRKKKKKSKKLVHDVYVCNTRE